MLRRSDIRPQAATATHPALPAGMRRVDWVRVAVSDGHASCEVVGWGHRLPAVRRVPLAVGAALAASGIPVIIRPRSEPPAGRSPRAA